MLKVASAKDPDGFGARRHKWPKKLSFDKVRCDAGIEETFDSGGEIEFAVVDNAETEWAVNSPRRGAGGFRGEGGEIGEAAFFPMDKILYSQKIGKGACEVSFESCFHSE